MGENPSNFYNNNIKYANPPSGGCNWDLDYYRTNYINAILLGQLKEGNYIKSGLVPTQGTGLNIEVTAGVAVIGGVEFEVNAFTKQAALAPLGDVEFNLVYVDNAGVGQVIQSDPSVIGCALAIVDTDDTAILRFMNAVQFLQYDTTPNPVFQNHIIDGDFNFWYEGISQTSSGYGSDTMWSNVSVGSTKVHTQEDFIPGQTDVPGGLKYYNRHVVTSVAGSANVVLKQQKIENVRKLAGKTLTLSLYAKADSSKDIALDFAQLFGTGGSPSSNVTGIGVATLSLTTTWQKFTVTIDFPSISGKTLGTDDNDSTSLSIYFDAGTNFDARTNSLGQQSGTFDIARVRLVEGKEDGNHISESIVEVSEKVSRYYIDNSSAVDNDRYIFCSDVTNGSIYYLRVGFPTKMRGAPVITPLNYSSTSSFPTTIPGISHISVNGFRADKTANATGPGGYYNFSYNADARL